MAKFGPILVSRIQEAVVYLGVVAEEQELGEFVAL